MSKSSEKVAAVKKTITESFVKALEEGLAHPEGWKAPWHSTGLRGAVNAVTGKRYHGGNVFWLSMSEHAGPWATYKQWASIGAQVRRGEKSTVVLTPMPFKREDKDTGKVKSGVFFGTASVFSADQVDGYEVPEVPETEGELPEEAEAFLAAIAKEITTVTSPEPRAFYSPGSDRVTLPEAFKTAEGRFSTSAHEYGHATGAHSRLNRDGVTGHHPFGSSGYAKEELIAEFTSAFLGATFGVETEMAVEGGIGQAHADYLANWLAVLKSDTNAVWQAATAASKASEFLLDLAAAKTEQAAA